jgi:hypothetical protein
VTPGACEDARVPDPFAALRLLAEDEVSGASRITKRAAGVLARLGSRREILRAARILLRAKGAMAPLWRVCAIAYDAPGASSIRGFAAALEEAQAVAARNARWLTGGSRRPPTVVTWSSASVLAPAIATLRAREVRCARSGGHGARLAAMLRRHGIAARTFDDVELVRAFDGADVALIGADAIGARVGNAAGSELFAIAAGALGVPVYVIAAEAKLLPAELVDRCARAPFEAFDASRVDAVITEHGPRSARWLASRAEAVEMPGVLRALVR